MSERKYTFIEWYRLCDSLRTMYRSCYQSCVSLSEVMDFGDLMRCHETCLNDVVEHGKNQLTEAEIKMCIYL